MGIVAGMTETIDNALARPDCDENPYLGDFSRRLAARLASLPARTASFGPEDDDELGISWKLLVRSYKLLLMFGAGAILYGATLYPLLSELRSPGVPATATETTAAVSR